MYPNVMGMPNTFGGYSGYNATNNQYSRLAQMEQQQMAAQQAVANQQYGLGQPNNPMMNQMGQQMPFQQQTQQPQPQNYLKGRPVTSIDEARAAQIDFDGSMFIFTDISNKKIYTKQINLDGTASLKTYALVEDPQPAQQTTEAAPQINYVTKTELERELAKFKDEMLGRRVEQNEQHESNANPADASVRTVREQPAF